MGRPHGTNDVDADKRRRTLAGVPVPYPFTFGVIEGSQERAMRAPSLRGRMGPWRSNGGGGCTVRSAVWRVA